MIELARALAMIAHMVVKKIENDPGLVVSLLRDHSVKTSGCTSVVIEDIILILDG